MDLNPLPSFGFGLSRINPDQGAIGGDESKLFQNFKAGMDLSIKKLENKFIEEEEIFKNKKRCQT